MTTSLINHAAMKSFFQRDMSIGISKFRFYLLRIFYLIIILMLGIVVWKELFIHLESWEPLPAVAFSFWAAFSALAILGVLHPLKMIPLLLVQFSYKLIWLMIVAYPLWSDHQLIDSNAWGLTRAT